MLKHLKLIGKIMKSNITSIYRLNNTKRALQGDILNNFQVPIYDEELKLLELKFGVILSQDCDLNQDFDSRDKISNLNTDENQPALNNKMIPSILICPAYPAEQLRKGTHLNTIDIPMIKISDSKKTPWKKIIQNETPRYHFLNGSDEFNVPELVLDFKRYYSVSREYLYSIYPECYYASLNELYREDLTNRFHHYHSQIGLP